MRAESDFYKLFDSTGKVYLDENNEGNRRGKNRPEIDRRQLRDMLLDSLTPGSINWGKKLRSVEASPGAVDLYDLHFKDGSVERGFNLVVGADGAWSKVRPLLTQEKPFYCGITAIVGTLNDLPNRHPEISELIGAGSCIACDDERTISAQVQSGDAAVTYAQLRVPERWVEESKINWDSPQAGQQLVDKYFPNWKQELKDFILRSDEPLVARPLYMLPIGMEWDTKTG
jgi:2-polyprenyl-6-methoxyphenol hydroxylase-like FAD-dependent oxidoreductase